MTASERADNDRSGPAQAVVFDCDGVIADTVGACSNAFVEVAHRHGLALARQQLARLHGSAIVPASESLARWLPEPVPALLIAQELEGQLVSSLAAADLASIEGLPDLLGKLSGAVPMAIASNAPRRAVLRVLARLGLTGYFSAVVSADDVARPKPSADAYVAACAALGADPYCSVAVEDSEIGAQSADAAGMTVIELASGPWSANGYVRRPPALRVRSLSDPQVVALALGFLPRTRADQGA